jgi:hypothetical protein
MHADTRHPELVAFIAVLREALQSLVGAIRDNASAPAAWKQSMLFSIEPATEYAERVLRMETGRHAQKDLDIQADLVCQAYILADWCWHSLYGTSRTARGTVPTRQDVEKALEEIDHLTRQSWTLDGLLSACQRPT